MPIPKPNWASLPDGVISSIAKLLEQGEFISFRGTCTSWRLATIYKDFQKEGFPGLPLLMIKPVKDGDNGDFFNFYTGKVISISLPEIRNKLCIGTKGWLITFAPSSGDMSLVNPTTRVEIRLPNISIDDSYCWLKTGILSATPTNTSDYVIMILYYKSPEQSTHIGIGYWKPGDPAWTTVETSIGLIQDVSFHKGMFYALSYTRKVWKLDVFGPDPTIPIEIMDLPAYLGSQYYEAFLVEYGGTLLAVSSIYKHLCIPRCVLELVELDLINATCKKITNLGDNAVFIGNNEGFCVDARRFPGVIRANYIYKSNGSYQMAGCEDRTDISPDEKVGMFYSDDTHSSPSHSDYSKAWVTTNF